MSLAYDVAVNAGSAVAGGVLTATGYQLRHRFRFRTSRSFWRFIEEPTVFVVGELPSDVLLNTLKQMLEHRVDVSDDQGSLADDIVDHVRNQEISGLVGRGDFEALTRMVSTFAALKLPTEPRVVHPKGVTPDTREGNLVLVGGRDVNALTEEFAETMGCQLKPMMNDAGRNIVRDHRMVKDHVVSSPPDPGVPHRVVDYGVLVRGPNPDGDDSEVLIFAGAHGLGTLAAAEVGIGKKYQNELRHNRREHPTGFECLVKYERFDTPESRGQPRITIEFAREITPVSPP